jgi:ABC-type nitrate/sulfonate/bicarbonate transport system permease component
MRSGLIRALSVASFLGIWQVASELSLAPAFLLPSPLDVIREGYGLIDAGILQRHVVSSMTRMLSGFGLALISGVILGALMGWFRLVDDIVDPLVELVRPVSPLALLPLSILWLGIGQASKIFTIWYGCIFPILLNTYSSVRNIPKSSVEAARILGAEPDEMLRKVVFFHSLPTILTGARISFAIGMIVIVAAEMVAADSGLGYMILTAQQTFQTKQLYVGIVTIAIIGFVGDRLIRFIRSFVCPWITEDQQQ